MTKTDPQIERDRIRALRWQYKRLPTKARAKRCRPKKETDGMTSAERTQRWRTRIAAGRVVYQVEADAVNTEALLEGFRLTTVNELLDLLTALDMELVTRHGTSLGSVVQYVMKELATDEE